MRLYHFLLLCLFLLSETIQAQDTLQIKHTDESKPGVSITGTSKSSKKIFTPYGDFRVRGEQDLRLSGNRFRGRFRIRVGMTAKISDEAKFDFRLVSTANPNDPNSSHVNLDDGFNQIRVAIDRAYFHLHPQRFQFLQWWIGKFSNPFLSSNIYSELVWDADIQPEGTAFSLSSSSFGKTGKINFVNGTYLMSQFKSGNRRNWLNTTQLSANWEISENWGLSLAGSFYYFANIKGQEINDPVLDANEGNSTFQNMVTDGSDTIITNHYQTDFFLLDNFVLLKFNKLPMPLLFKFQQLYNFGAQKRNQGYVAGISYGDLKDKNQWKVYYQYHLIQQDAVFTPFAQDDALRKTNAKGHVFGIAYAFHKKISLHAWGLVDSPMKDSGDVQSRFRLDLNVKF